MSNPILLAMNTCGTIGSVALGRVQISGPGLAAIDILAQAEVTGRAFSAELIPKIRGLLAQSRATVGDLGAIVAVRGPGSFTGIRIGLSTAKGLAEAGGIPVIGLSRLALLASVSRLPHVLAVIGAGRGEYYVGEYREGRNRGERLLSGNATCAAARHPGAGVLVYEEGEEGTESALAPCRPLPFPAPDAADALRLALGRFLAGDFEDIETLDANYLRRSAVELFGAADREHS